MRWPRPLGVVESADLRDVDPARAWVLVGDLSRMPEWAGAAEVEQPPERPGVDDEFSAVHQLGPLRYRVTYEVAAWEAGRRFRLRAAGLPLSEGVELRVSVEAMVEGGSTWARLTIGRAATVPAPVWPVAVWLARRGARRSLRRLRRALV